MDGSGRFGGVRSDMAKVIIYGPLFLKNDGIQGAISIETDEEYWEDVLTLGWRVDEANGRAFRAQNVVVVEGELKRKSTPESTDKPEATDKDDSKHSNYAANVIYPLLLILMGLFGYLMA